MIVIGHDDVMMMIADVTDTDDRTCLSRCKLHVYVFVFRLCVFCLPLAA